MLENVNEECQHMAIHTLIQLSAEMSERYENANAGLEYAADLNEDTTNIVAIAVATRSAAHALAHELTVFLNVYEDDFGLEYSPSVVDAREKAEMAYGDYLMSAAEHLQSTAFVPGGTWETAEQMRRDEDRLEEANGTLMGALLVWFDDVHVPVVEEALPLYLEAPAPKGLVN